MLEGQAGARRGLAIRARIASRPSSPEIERLAGLVLGDLGCEAEPLVLADVGEVGERRGRSRPAAGRRRWATSSDRSRRAALARATSTAAGEASEAVTTRSGRSSRSASAIAPEPVPTSCTRAPCGQLERDLDQQLGLGARDQHARVDGELDVAKPLPAEDVGDRLALDAAAHVLADQRAPGPRRARAPAR